MFFRDKCRAFHMIALYLAVLVVAMQCITWTTNFTRAQTLAEKISESKQQQQPGEKTQGGNQPPQNYSARRGSFLPNNSASGSDFDYLDTAKSESKGKKSPEALNSYLGHEFMKISHPVNGEVIALNSNYNISWKPDDTIPIDVSNIEVYIVKNQDSEYKRVTPNLNREESVDANRPISVQIPGNIPEGNYAFEFVGITGSSNGVGYVGPQFSRSFSLSANNPNFMSRVSSTMKGYISS